MHLVHGNSNIQGNYFQWHRQDFAKWRIVFFFQPTTSIQKIISASLIPLEEKYKMGFIPFLCLYETFFYIWVLHGTFFFILPEQGRIYLEKIRPVLALRSPPGQPSYFFLNLQGRQLRNSNMSNFFTESFEKCSGEKGVRPKMIHHDTIWGAQTWKIANFFWVAWIFELFYSSFEFEIVKKKRLNSPAFFIHDCENFFREVYKYLLNC